MLLNYYKKSSTQLTQNLTNIIARTSRKSTSRKEGPRRKWILRKTRRRGRPRGRWIGS